MKRYIRASREPKWWGSMYSCQVIDAYNNGELTYKNIGDWETAYNGGFKPSNMGTKAILDYYIKTGKDPRDEVEACGSIKASTIGGTNIKYVQSDSNFSPEQYDYDLPLPNHIGFCGCGGRSWVDLTSDNLDTWDSCEAAVDDAYQNYRPGTTVYIYKIDMANRSVLELCNVVEIPDEVEASSKITASDNERGVMNLLRQQALNVQLPEDIVLTDNGAADLERKGISGYYTWVGYKHPASGRSSRRMAQETERVAYDIIKPAMAKYCGVKDNHSNVHVDDFIDSVDMFRVWVESAAVKACSDINTSTEPKYFANMVSCSDYIDDQDEPTYKISGYYDKNMMGLAESSESSDLSKINEIANEYANKGYYIEVRNLTYGTILEFDADTWFNEMYPDGIYEI